MAETATCWGILLLGGRAHCSNVMQQSMAQWKRKQLWLVFLIIESLRVTGFNCSEMGHSSVCVRLNGFVKLLWGFITVYSAKLRENIKMQAIAITAHSSQGIKSLFITTWTSLILHHYWHYLHLWQCLHHYIYSHTLNSFLYTSCEHKNHKKK